MVFTYNSLLPDFVICVFMYTDAGGRYQVSLSHRQETGKDLCFEEALSCLGQPNLLKAIPQAHHRQT